jgi:hypothetical protein
VTFTSEFESTFLEALRRVSHSPNESMPTTSLREGVSVTPDTKKSGVSLDDFYAYMPTHRYIYAPTREMWPAASINSRLPSIQTSSKKFIPASEWLDRRRPVEQMTWAPGLPMLINNKLISDGGWINRDGVTTFNLYRPPIDNPGDPKKAIPWLKHGIRVFGKEHFRHIVRWCAHRVQRPGDKINHALVLGGSQGIGKDTLLEPVKRAIGPWNFCEVSPQHMLGRFNGFLKSVILRVNEARDLGNLDRFAFYDHMKTYLAAPPDVLRVDEKNLREYSILNCLAVIITTNHKADGIYLPADDRRHYVAWSERKKEEFAADYWAKFWAWLNSGGDAHVAAYLRQYDLRAFDPKTPPRKTAAYWEIVDASRAPEDAELADAIEVLRSPAALTLEQVASRANGAFLEWLRDRKNTRRIPHRLEACGYVAVRNDGAKDGLFKIAGRRQVIYAKAELSMRERIAAAHDLVGEVSEVSDPPSPYP